MVMAIPAMVAPAALVAHTFQKATSGQANNNILRSEDVALVFVCRNHPNKAFLTNFFFFLHPVGPWHSMFERPAAITTAACFCICSNLDLLMVCLYFRLIIFFFSVQICTPSVELECLCNNYLIVELLFSTQSSCVHVVKCHSSVTTVFHDLVVPVASEWNSVTEVAEQQNRRLFLHEKNSATEVAE